jgi:hypothetical protein
VLCAFLKAEMITGVLDDLRIAVGERVGVDAYLVLVEWIRPLDA